MPYTLDLTIYGISSIVPGDTFTVDYLPKAHLENTFLQVTKIAQNVDSSGWYTSLQTQYRPFYPEKKANIFSSIKPNKGTSRLSPTCLISEFKIKTSKTDSPLINDKYMSNSEASDRDSVLSLSTFFKYITDITYETQPDDSRIDHILHFKTSKNIIEDFVSKNDDWYESDTKTGLIHNHRVNQFKCSSSNQLLKTDTDWIKNKGFKYNQRVSALQGDAWMDMWRGDYQPDLMWHTQFGNKKDTGGTVIRRRWVLPSFSIQDNTWYRLWIRDGSVVIIKPNYSRSTITPDNSESERYKKLLKFFQKNTFVNRSEWKF